jgi:hypothetical protein
VTQSIPTIEIGNLHDPNDIVQGNTMETRIYYRDATKISFIEKSTGIELKPLTPEIAKEIRKRIALGEVEEKSEVVEVATTPLPADAWHMNYYTKKGFRLWARGQAPNQETQDALQARIRELESQLKAEADSDLPVQGGNPLACQVAGCPFKATTFLGLARHMRTKHDQK